MNTFYQYQFVDNGSGLSFLWVTKNPMTEGSRYDHMRDMLRNLFVENKVRGSREVIDMARAVTKLPEAKLLTLFGRGSDCEVIGMAAFNTDLQIFQEQTKHRVLFAHSVREYLLGIPYDSDVFESGVNAVDATDSVSVGQSNKILVECYRRCNQQELASREFYDTVRSGFIQCRYTGRCWPFRTKKIGTFNAVFTRRVQDSRDQFLLWIEQDRFSKNQIAGAPLMYEEATITKLKNVSLYLSLDRDIMVRYYRIPAGAEEK